jgi:hypothetical protein
MKGPFEGEDQGGALQVQSKWIFHTLESEITQLNAQEADELARLLGYDSVAHLGPSKRNATPKRW